MISCSDEEEDEADTLGGLIFEMAGRVPTRGEIIKHDSGLEFEILQSDARRVKRIRIHVKKQRREAPMKAPKMRRVKAGPPLVHIS